MWFICNFVFLTYSKDILHRLLHKLINIVGPGWRKKNYLPTQTSYKNTSVKQHFDSPGFRSRSSANAEPRALLLLPRTVINGDFIVWSPMKREGKMGFEGFILHPVANRNPQVRGDGGGCMKWRRKSGWRDAMSLGHGLWQVPQHHRQVGRDRYLEDRDSPMKISLSPRTGSR